MRMYAMTGLAALVLSGGAVFGAMSADAEDTSKMIAPAVAEARVAAAVAAAVRGEDIRSDHAQAAAVKRVRATMKRRAKRSVAGARKAGYENGTADAAAVAPAPAPAPTNTPGGATVMPGGDYSAAQQDSFANGGDGSHDSEGYATGEGCSDNPAAPMSAC